MPEQNEPPQIPSFKPTQKKDKKGGSLPLSSLGKPAPAPLTPGAATTGGMPWPSAGTTGIAPKLRVRGLPGGATLIDRLKNLQKKDLMLIGAGLSVLLMAPLAEHFLMTPEQDNQVLKEGFAQTGPLFPDGSTIYESGTGGFSPGSLIGAGTDVITPLNVRDPSALVMGPGATQKPSATVTPPPPSEEGPSKSSWKDALAQAANKGVQKAVSKAPLPKPNVKMGGALRGLSALSGSSSGGGASFKLPGLDASNVPNKARDSNALSRVQADPRFRGAASRSGSSGGGPEDLKAAGMRQSDIFNKGKAGNALDTASKESMPSGGGFGTGGGSPSDGDPSKNPGGSNSKDNRSIGESLAFLRAKMEMEKAIALKWKKKEWKEFERRKMMEEMVIKSAIENLLGKGIFEPIGKGIGKAVGKMFPDAKNSIIACKHPKSGGVFTFDTSEIDNDKVWMDDAGNLYKNGQHIGEGCTSSGAGKTGQNAGRQHEHVPAKVDGTRGTGALGEDANSGTAAQTWGAGITQLSSIIGAIKGKIPEKCADKPCEELKAASEKAVESLDAARKSHEAGKAANDTARGTIKEANKKLDTILGAHNGWLTQEKAVSADSKKAVVSLDKAVKLMQKEQDASAEFTTAEKDYGAMKAKIEDPKSGVDSFVSKQNPELDKVKDDLDGDKAQSAKKQLESAGASVGEAEKKVDSELDGTINLVAEKEAAVKAAAGKGAAEGSILTFLAGAKNALSETNRLGRTALEKSEGFRAKSLETEGATEKSDAAMLQGNELQGDQAVAGGQKLTGFAKGAGLPGEGAAKDAPVSTAKATDDAYTKVKTAAGTFKDWQYAKGIGLVGDQAKLQFETARTAAEKAVATATSAQTAADAGLAVSATTRKTAVDLLGTMPTAPTQDPGEG